MAKFKNWILLGIVGVVAVVAGLMLPQLLTGFGGNKTAAAAGEAAGKEGEHGDAKKDEHAKAEGKADDHGKKEGHAADGHGKDGHGKAAPDLGPKFISFGRMVVNLNDERLVRFLAVEVSLQVDPAHVSEVDRGIQAKRPILKSWLTSHLADKTVDDLRGKAGINRLRREIQDEFNQILFPDGFEKILEVHFEEFAVQ